MTDHAHELRRYARKIAHPAGDVPAVMLAAADEIECLRSENAGLVDDMNLLRDNNTALRARIEAMEQQEPFAWLHESRRDSDVVTSAVKHVWGKVAVGSLAAYSIPLYLAPGAQPAPIIPEGWKLVPIEPTHEMKTAAIGVEVYQDSPPSTDCLTWEEAGAIYAAMLAAAAAPEAKP